MTFDKLKRFAQCNFLEYFSIFILVSLLSLDPLVYYLVHWSHQAHRKTRITKFTFKALKLYTLSVLFFFLWDLLQRTCFGIEGKKITKTMPISSMLSAFIYLLQILQQPDPLSEVPYHRIGWCNIKWEKLFVTNTHFGLQ